MLEEKDIKNLLEVFTTKEDFNDFRDKTRKSFSDLKVSIDAYAKKADTYFQEMAMLSHKVDRHEKWLLKIAEKLDLKLDY